MAYEASFIGLLLSLIYISLTGLYPGGVIVPSYLVLFLDHPFRLAAVLLAALAAWISFRFASRHLILFGTRRVVFMVLVGALGMLLGGRVFPALIPESTELQFVGWVIPGLIANHFERQGVWPTLASLTTVTIAAYFLGRAWNGLF